jgi:hypothetical protein
LSLASVKDILPLDFAGKKGRDGGVVCQNDLVNLARSSMLAYRITPCFI